MKNEIRNATESALVDFWVEIAKQFPNVQTGDFPVQETHKMHVFMEEMVELWLETNSTNEIEYK
jgi:hypothetical protein